MSERYPDFPLGDDALREELLAAYREPRRAYHGVDHLVAVLTAIDDLLAAGEPASDPLALRLAAWFHDAVYDPRRDDNEDASARLAEARLTAAGLEPARVARVAALVRATAAHTVTDADAALLMDADLSVLAAPAPRYAGYVAAVRREYAHLGEAQWRRGRSAVLQRLLARRPLFATATMRRAGEARARGNLAAELARLQATVADTPAARRWRERLDAWAIPDSILAAAPRSPWGFDVATFARAADDARGRDTPSRRRALEALGAGGSVLDVGCGAGAAGYALVPPADPVIGVDASPQMLAAFAERGDKLDVGHRELHATWPDDAPAAPVADVVVCHHVVHNVADLPAFAQALTAHARRRVVVEMTTTHPLAWTAPLWQRFHALPRDPGPTVDDAVAVLHELGLSPQVQRWQGPSPWGDLDRAVISARIRLCLPASRDDEIRAALRACGAPAQRELATLHWPGAAGTQPGGRG